MLGTLVLFAAACVMFVTGIALRSKIVSSGGHELCWSCGQRAQHKLWCPNR